MSGATKIEWTDATWNPFRGCSRISPGCQNCYAERLAARFSYEGGWGEGYAEMTEGGPRWTRKVALVEHSLRWPIHYKGHPDAMAAGRPTRIFVNSTSDMFHEALDDDAIDRAFAVMADASRHTFQVLTKRADRLPRFLGDEKRRRTRIAGWLKGNHFACADDCSVWLNTWPVPNVWLGVSVEDRAHKGRIEALRATPAAVRFLSLEPLLEDLGDLDLLGISWVIVGGESGIDARMCDLGWIRSIVRQCRAAGVAVFVKQVGSAPVGSCCDVLPPNVDFHDTPRYQIPIKNRKGADPSEWPEDIRIQEYPRRGIAA